MGIFDKFKKDDLAMLVKNAVELHKLGRYDESIKYYDEILGLKPEHQLDC